VILAGCIALLVLVAARWLIGRALEPVATMTRQASLWSEHDLDRRFSPGDAQDEIAQLATTLNGLLERLGASLRHEQRLSAEISHELRTPLAGVIAEAQFAQRHGVEDQTLTRILERSQELRRTLDALMAAARAGYSPRVARAGRRRSDRRHSARADRVGRQTARRARDGGSRARTGPTDPRAAA
jgi:signal transduction histidine kinase